MADPISITMAWRRTIGRRVLVVACLFAVWVAAIEARLVQLQVFQYEKQKALADEQGTYTLDAPAKRGEILDRHGRLLAYSVDVDSIVAFPIEIKDAAGTAAALCAALNGCSPEDRAKLTDVLSTRRQFAYVRREASPEEARRVAALKLRGIVIVDTDHRFYPNGKLAAHVLGYVGTDNTGLAGIEATYDSRIRGRNGQILVQKDGKKHAYGRVERPPTVGATLELTIDENLQHVVERELRAGIAENHAEGGSVVVMDPMTGEILALASEPTFNPNLFGKFDRSELRNRAVQDLYEPGSTFKIVTASAAFEENVVTPNDLIDVSSGAIQIGARVISDVHRNGVLSVTQVLVKSSNVGAIRIGLRVGAERLGRYVHRFGFGTRMSPDFPAESPGKVWDAARLSDSALASISMGYQIGVTPLQMAAAASSIANGGELVQPRVVRALIRDGVRTEVPRTVVRRAVTPATAATLTGIMEEVVEEGTGTAARIPGYTVAGKTGTAQRLIDRHYSKTEYNASFVAFVPSRKPALTILVLVNSPHGKSGYFGGSVAAPIFKRIAEEALRHLGIAPTVNPPSPILVARQGLTVALPGAPAGARVNVVPAASTDPAVQGLVPDLVGLSARDAVRALARVGLTPRLQGDGIVVEQDPPPGTALEPGGPCMLSLARSSPAAASGARQ